MKFCFNRSKEKPHQSDISLPRNSLDDAPTLEYLYHLLDAHLKELEITRGEIHLEMQLEENTMNYQILLAVSLISASQLFSNLFTQLITTLNNNPYIYLGLGIVCLIFPMTILNKGLHSMVLGAYITYVLSPKINQIFKLLSTQDERSRGMEIWENEQLPFWLRGTIKWGEYRPRVEQRGVMGVAYNIYFGFRFIFSLFAPAFFIYNFFYIKSTTNSLLFLNSIEFVLVAFFLLLSVAILFNIWLIVKGFSDLIRLQNGKFKSY